MLPGTSSQATLRSSPVATGMTFLLSIYIYIKLMVGVLNFIAVRSKVTIGIIFLPHVRQS